MEHYPSFNKRLRKEISLKILMEKKFEKEEVVNEETSETNDIDRELNRT